MTAVASEKGTREPARAAGAGPTSAGASVRVEPASVDPYSRSFENDDVVAPEVGFAWLLDGTRKYLGYILLFLGIIFLIVGWYGAAGESIVAKQIPYLASGGLGGVALVVIGGRILLIDDLRRDSGRLDRVETMVAELHGILLARAGEETLLDSHRPARRGGSSLHSIAATGPVGFEVVTGGTTYHLPGCEMTQGKKHSTVGASTVAKRGLGPCPLCQPGDATILA